MALKQSATLYKQKQIYFWLADLQLAENLIFALGSYKKDKTRIKQICYQICMNYNCNHLSIKNFSQIASKIFVFSKT